MTDVENATAALSLDDALDGGGDNNPFAIEKQADDEKLKKEERAKKFGTNARMQGGAHDGICQYAHVVS